MIAIRRGRNVQLTQSENRPLSLVPPSLPAVRALILAGHADTTALLDDFVVRSGLTPVHPLDDEPVDQAVARTRPRVAIVDFDHPCAMSQRLPEWLGAVGARLLLCAALHRNAEARDRALRTGSLYFPLPIAYRDFDLVLRTALLL